ncbi:hypothetical protein BIY23_02360 [Wolbachia pipientis]|uniref:Trigger factor C-terminal domain-containing protein n=1 Tax=Wolbachia pipientis TaxID=955 RepID=A0A1E7QKD8_WOLPI|nr:hypothetical protein [Wolbachia pipientis]OEY86684.1 hypothetical protein BIY23_02360 [Wolbachia pipientis]
MELANNIELIEHVKKIIDFDCSKMIELLTKKQLFDYLDAEYSFDLPEDMIKEELQRLHEEQDPKKEELQQLHEEPGHEKEAEKRVKFAMLFMKFCAEHQLKITTEDLMKTTLNYYRETQSAKNNDFEDLDEMIKFMRKNRDFLYFLEGQALEHKVINYIIERANKDQHDVSVNALRELFDNTFNKEIKSGEV